MAETKNIGDMAEIISDEIFSEFFWEKVGSTNINWGCVQSDKHGGKKTHPSDVVFKYQDPYEQKDIYINFDLKSYQENSISVREIRTALESLAMASECTQISSDWQKIYTIPSTQFEIISSLFVYNHDNSFDRNFEKLLSDATQKGISMSAGNKIFVFSPQKIQYLKTVINDMQTLRGKQVLPMQENYTFFYPTLNNKQTRNPWSSSATIETLFNTWQIIKYRINIGNPKSDNFGIIVYYSKNGETQEEFRYLIDYLAHYQIISDASNIMIKVANADKYASVNFQNAITEYKMRFGLEDESSQKLESIKFESITRLITEFSEFEIGMVH